MSFQGSKESLIDFLSGSVGGACGVLVGQPMDTVKVKLQTFPHLYNGTVGCVREIIKRDGVRGLYAGTLPSLAANIGENSILLTAYGLCQKGIARVTNTQKLDEMSLSSLALSGSCASFFSSLIICPTELIKCKLQGLREVNKGKKMNIGISTVIRNILKTEGMKGMFMGLVPTCSREMPGYFFFFLSYESTRTLLTPTGGSKDDLGALQTVMCGGIAGCTFWISVFPMDVIKSRIQVLGDRRNIAAVGLNIIRAEGFRSLYNGLTPSLLRTFPATAALFLAYENTKKLLSGF
ncbi:mitochondrial ornithine transporter 1 [Eurytemora carolleeae]|uniref:mitochondrial ornithine transporter 1 n=1 Tax=Eurytemora carolleeae TaxID=1294199 RepID=UPI000C789149|nr:mitochondrial ornithine transporter 1 [Eurytemora carolleeae]|eukprot:XP_023346709.1 mitochondrial ornithine transporter 1-like [Eurytemora affinis]